MVWHLIWVNLITTSLVSLTIIIVSKGNDPQMAQQFRLVNYYNLPRSNIDIQTHMILAIDRRWLSVKHHMICYLSPESNALEKCVGHGTFHRRLWRFSKWGEIGIEEWRGILGLWGINIYIYMYYIWVNLITTWLFSLTGIMVDKGNHPLLWPNNSGLGPLRKIGGLNSG